MNNRNFSRVCRKRSQALWKKNDLGHYLIIQRVSGILVAQIKTAEIVFGNVDMLEPCFHFAAAVQMMQVGVQVVEAKAHIRQILHVWGTETYWRRAANCETTTTTTTTKLRIISNKEISTERHA